MSPQQNVAARIRELRERHGWSLAQLARELERFGAGLDRSQVARTESCERNLPLDELLLFAAALNTSVLSLLFPPNVEQVVIAKHETHTTRWEFSRDEALKWARGDYAPVWIDGRMYYRNEVE